MPSVHITPPPLSTQSMADLMCTVVVLCEGENEQKRHFWAYLGIKPSMAKAFHEACASGCFNLEDFGTVIEYGEGVQIPSAVQKRMERYYGVDHEYEAHLRETLAVLQEQNGQQ
jgi:hypothetical protein